MDTKKTEIKTVEVRENQEIKKIEVPTAKIEWKMFKPSISFKCIICEESEELESQHIHYTIPICKNCLKDLKEIILEKRSNKNSK